LKYVHTGGIVVDVVVFVVVVLEFVAFEEEVPFMPPVPFAVEFPLPAVRLAAKLFEVLFASIDVEFCLVEVELPAVAAFEPLIAAESLFKVSDEMFEEFAFASEPEPLLLLAVPVASAEDPLFPVFEAGLSADPEAP
jgi:hypothetical protein